MSTDHDIMRLPDPPPPAPDARAAALQQALAAFRSKKCRERPRNADRHPSHRANRRALAAVTREVCHESYAISPGCQPGLYCCRIGRLSPSHAVAAVAGRRCARRTEGGQQRRRSSSFDQCKQRRKAKARPSRKRKSKPPLRPESPTRKPPRLRLRRRRLPPSRTWKIRSPACSLRRRLPRRAARIAAPCRGYMPLADARGRYAEPERSQPHARAAVSICAADGAGRSLAGPHPARARSWLRPSLSAATSLPMRRKTPSRSRAMRRSRHSPSMSIRRRTRSSAHSSTAMCCRRPRPFGPRS